MAKAAFRKKKALFTSKLKSYLRNQIVKCYFFGIAFCGSGTRTLREVDKEYVGNFHMWCCRRMEKISVRNEALLNNATLLGEFPKIFTLTNETWKPKYRS
jgi:hypothetical protein